MIRLLILLSVMTITDNLHAAATSSQEQNTKQKALALFFKAKEEYEGTKELAPNYKMAISDLRAALEIRGGLFRDQRANAFTMIGMMQYSGGHGINRNYKHAVSNLEKATMHRDSLSQAALAKIHYFIGFMWNEGNFEIVQDKKKAAQHFERALFIANGLNDLAFPREWHVKAHSMLGEFYVTIEHDIQKSLQHYDMLLTIPEAHAKPNIPRVLFNIGTKYFSGDHVEKNNSIAREYYVRALALRGLDAELQSQINFWLASMYQTGGYGIERNNLEALTYYQRVLANEATMPNWRTYTHLNIAQIYCYDDQNIPNLSRAHEHYTTTLTLAGTTFPELWRAKIHVKLGEIEIRQAKYVDALRNLKRAIRIPELPAGDKAHAHARIGELFWTKKEGIRKNSRLALRHLDAALNIPELHPTLRERAQEYISHMHWRGA